MTIEKKMRERERKRPSQKGQDPAAGDDSAREVKEEKDKCKGRNGTSGWDWQRELYRMKLCKGGRVLR